MSEGPNAGWSYLTGTDSPVQFDQHVIALNEVMARPDADEASRSFWAAQPRTPECAPAAVLSMVRRHEEHHADLYDRNRGIIDAEAEAAMAYVDAATWNEMLGVNGEILDRWSRQIHLLSGGSHRREDGFPRTACHLNFTGER